MSIDYPIYDLHEAGDAIFKLENDIGLPKVSDDETLYEKIKRIDRMLKDANERLEYLEIMHRREVIKKNDCKTKA